jgi:hypothetical protein
MTHLDDETLARLRGDEERDEDAEAFRHLASCAICRARMVEDPKVVRDVARPPAKVIALSDRRASGKVLVAVSGVIVAAAVFVIMMLAMRRPHEAPPIALRSRSYAGTMGGSSPAPSASMQPRDLDYELSFDAPENTVAKLVLIDTFGRQLAPLRTFERAGGQLRVVVAPRTFAKHEGEARAIVLAGGESAVAAASKDIDAAFAQGPLAAEELAAIAQRYTLSRGGVPLP